MASKCHREALLRALATARVSTEATAEDLVAFVQKPQVEITFSDKDLPLEGRNHTKPLFIQAEINGRLTRNVMVDDGSALNVCPLKLLSKFRIETSELEPSSMVIRAYNNTKRGVEGTFVAKIKVGPVESIIDVTVLDIPATFAMLLGRPWFHTLGGVPSTLHRKIKFPLENEVVTICAQEEANVALVGESEMEMPMTGFQVVMLESDNKGEKIMKRFNYKRGSGLGKHGQGVREPISAYQMVEKRAGLGYNGGHKGPNDIQEPKFEKGLDRQFFTPAAYEDFEVDGKVYPGLRVFMADFEDTALYSPSSPKSLVEGSGGMYEAYKSAPTFEQLAREFEDLLGIGGQASQATTQELMNQETEKALVTKALVEAGQELIQKVADAVIDEEPDMDGTVIEPKEELTLTQKNAALALEPE